MKDVMPLENDQSERLKSSIVEERIGFANETLMLTETE